MLSLEFLLLYYPVQQTTCIGLAAAYKSAIRGLPRAEKDQSNTHKESSNESMKAKTKRKRKRKEQYHKAHARKKKKKNALD